MFIFFNFLKVEAQLRLQLLKSAKNHVERSKELLSQNVKQNANSNGLDDQHPATINKEDSKGHSINVENRIHF